MKGPKPRPDRKESILLKKEYRIVRLDLTAWATTAVLLALAFAIVVFTCTGVYCLLRSVG